MGKTYRNDELEGRRAGAAYDAADKRERFERREFDRDAKRVTRDFSAQTPSRERFRDWGRK